MKKIQLEHPIIGTGRKLRSMMSWIGKSAEGQE
jgi:ketol-acid reductoisomerase